ncbi:MAG: bifunctional diguanylate cyclase/phosphodiesterase [Longimicrobiales bacterium]
MAKDTGPLSTRRDLSAAAAAGALQRTVVEDLGQRKAMAGALRDTVERAEQRHAFLAKIGVVAATAADAASLANRVAALVLPTLADWCVIEVLDADGATRRCIASVHCEPQHDELVRMRLGIVEAHDGSSPLADVFRTGKPHIGVVDESSGWIADAGALDQRLLCELGIRSCIVQPLLSRGLPVGVMAFLSADNARYAADELNLTGDIARRVAAALDNFLLADTLDAVRVAEERYRSLFDASRDAVYITDLDGGFVAVNASFLELFGYTRAELAEVNARALYFDPGDRRAFQDMIASGDAVRDFESTLKTRDGEPLACVISASVRRDGAGVAIGYHGIVHDITQRKRAEEQLKRSEHFMRTILSSVDEGVIVYDRDLRHQMWNSFMEQLTGRRSEDVLGMRALDAFPYLREYGVERLLQRALAGETVQSPDTPYRVPHTGRSGWVSTSYSPHLAPTGEIVGVVGIVHDVSERKRAEEQLMHNALHDVLTGLPNRALFLDRLERLLTHGSRDPQYVFAVAFLDVDRFKVVNDSLGHMIGDELLIAIARRLESCLRLGDTVARFGGDEFAILLSGVHDIADTTRVAERILREFVEPFAVGGHEVFASASMGVALSNTGYEQGEAMLRDADTAMYRAKGAGRGRFEIFDRTMHTQAVLQLELETDLRRALERAELVVHYQPIVNLDDGRLAGFEALVRWQHPTKGLIQPGDFIPLAEETGAIVPIGWWVLRESCRQMREWDHRYPGGGLTVSVNLSGRQFTQPDLLTQLDRILTETGFEAKRLKLEITESAVMQNSASVPATLSALRGRGVQLCLDDFGTGYSSLSYLHSFPLDTLKIDRSFVAALGTDTPKAELVQTILELGRSLGMDATAEGVESAEQLDMLRALGPRHVQGFFFATPLQPADAEALIRDGHSWGDVVA